MNTYKNKWNSLWQREQSFEFMDEEWDLDEEILSEGATAKSAVFESNIQLSMKKTIFKTKRIARWEKKLLVSTTNKENINLEHSQAVERSKVLFEAKSIPNSPSSYSANKEESKLIYSCGKINTSCPSPNTLKDEISQLLRWLARKRNASTFKLTSNKPELISELENKDCSNLDVNIKISSLHLNNTMIYKK